MVKDEKFYWKDRQILIVEDDDSSSFLLGEILKRTGASLSYAGTGDEAVEYIRENPKTDLVLMDIQLPDKDGITATREIKQINQSIYVITQSAYLHLTNVNRRGAGYADDFLSKPINPKLLLSKIDTFFGLGSI